MSLRHRLQALAVLACVIAVSSALAGSSAFSASSEEARVETSPGKNGRIAFTRYADANRSSGSIYVIDANGKNAHRVTRAPAGARDTQPDWSPDGSLLVFERQYDDREWETYSVRPDGSSLTRIDPGCPGVPGAELCESSQPALSPDGTKIAYTSAYGRLRKINGDTWIDVGAIAVMNVDGSERRQLTQLKRPTSSEHTQPFWSPDGRRIGFVRANFIATPRGQQAIFVMNANGTGIRRVTPWAMQAGDHPDWSPDGKWIVFRSPGHGGFAGTDLYRVHPNGAGLQPLTKTKADVEVFSASYSPDGKSIVFAQTGRGGLPDLYVMRSDGSGVRQLTRTARWDSAPDWAAK
jgi:Tol biopolymer transport system component